jgi:hypothetical protein
LTTRSQKERTESRHMRCSSVRLKSMAPSTGGCRVAAARARAQVRGAVPAAGWDAVSMQWSDGTISRCSARRAGIAVREAIAQGCLRG